MKRAMLVLLLAAVAALGQEGAPQPCWGSDARCPDGKYRGRDGQEQPETCDNDEHGAAAVHSCKCNRMQEPEHCDPSGARPHESGDCSVYCRGNACACRNSCDD